MDRVLLSVISLSICASTVAVNCPSGWLAHAQKCYHISHDKEQWMVARLICQSSGGDLAEVETYNEYMFLRNEAALKDPSNFFWLAGNDLTEEGVWVWAASGNPITEYVNWHPGEPSNSAGDENCMNIHSRYDGWNDGACSFVSKYICERDPV